MIVGNILPVCKKKKRSEISTNKMMDNYGNNVKKAKLGMAFLEICAVADAGKEFCESCYMVKGDSCLII